MITAKNKEIGLNGFYFWQDQKYGTVQSAGAMPSLASVGMLINYPGWQAAALRLMSPAVRAIYDRFFNGGLVLARSWKTCAIWTTAAMQLAQHRRPPAAADSGCR